MCKNGTLKEVIISWRRGDTDKWTTPNGSLFHRNGILFSYGSHFPIALRVGGAILVNGDTYSVSTSKHQSYLIQEINENGRVEIPFSALDKALTGHSGYSGYHLNMEDLKLNLQVLDSKGDTWIDTGRVSEKTGEKIFQHVLGACILSYTKDDEVRYFFSGIDETGKGTHRYFLTELVSPVSTVAEGLESMKPQEVKNAENEGKKVLRQGEWFFVRCDDQEACKVRTKGLEEKDYILRGVNGDTGHHKVSLGAYTVIDNIPTQIVRGIVKHVEGDHKQLKLYSDVKNKEYYLAYHNVQVQSFNSLGNVD